MGRVLYNNGKWRGVWNLPKYQEMRDKIKESFKDLTFVEEGHKYYINGEEITCVSNVIHQFQEHFDAPTKAKECSERYWNDESSIYYHMTPAEIEAAWEANSRNACEVGSERHEFGESCLYYMTEQYDKILPGFKDRLREDGGFEAIQPKEVAIVKYWEDLPACFIPIAAENLTYRKDLGYAGTFDILFYYDAELNGGTAEQSGAVIFDYKTNKDLYKNFKGKTLLYPLEGLLDCPLSIYKAQLSLYELSLRKIGFKIIGRRLIWLRPDESYDKIPLESYADRLEEYLLTHKSV